MRRIVGLAGTALVLAAGALAVGASPASGAAGSLTVKTLGRDGRYVRTYLQAINSSTRQLYTFYSGHTRTLPDGTYVVVGDIFNLRDYTDTLGAKRITVSGATSATMDARNGRAVSAQLQPSLPGGFDQRLQAVICVGNSAAQINAENSGGKLYVIPAALPSIEFAYSSEWSPGGGTGDGPIYMRATVHDGGLPNGISTTFHQAGLARLDIIARTGPVSGGPVIQLNAETSDACEDSVLVADADAAPLPTSFTAYIPAAKWFVGETAQDYSSSPYRRFAAGQTYTMRLNRAVWGPGGDLPYIDTGRLIVDGANMFVDSVLSNGPADKATCTLRFGGTTIASRSGSDAQINKLLPRAGWYTATISATRTSNPALPLAPLSTRARLRLHFYADPSLDVQVRDFVPRMLAAGLDLHNQAGPGTTTNISLTAQRSRPAIPYRQSADAVRNFAAWYSTDNGSTWHAAHVVHPGGNWTMAVPNPASGFVSLRVTVTDTHGDDATATVIRAYAIG